MEKGTVKFFNDAKGFGFIKVDGSNDEVFVHAKGLKSGVKISDNDRVKFNIEQGKKGLQAVKVELE